MVCAFPSVKFSCWSCSGETVMHFNGSRLQLLLCLWSYSIRNRGKLKFDMLYFLVFHFIPPLLSQNKAFHSELGIVVPTEALWGKGAGQQSKLQRRWHFTKDAALCLKDMGYLETSGGLNVPLNFILQLTVTFCIKNSTCVWGRSVTFQD